MKERIQLNLRMDDQQELIKAVKARAKEERITVKELVIDALQKRLQLSFTDTASPTSQSTSQTITRTEAHDLKERINGLRIGLMGEIRHRDERLDQHEGLIAELASAIARLEARIDSIPAPPFSDTVPKGKAKQTRQTRQKGTTEIQPPVIPQPDLTDEEVEKLSPWKQWEAVCTDLVDGLKWEDLGNGRD